MLFPVPVTRARPDNPLPDKWFRPRELGKERGLATRSCPYWEKMRLFTAWLPYSWLLWCLGVGKEKKSSPSEGAPDLTGWGIRVFGITANSVDRWREVPCSNVRNRYHQYIREIIHLRSTGLFFRCLNLCISCYRTNIHWPASKQRLDGMSLRFEFEAMIKLW